MRREIIPGTEHVLSKAFKSCVVRKREWGPSGDAALSAVRTKPGKSEGTKDGNQNWDRSSSCSNASTSDD